MRVEQKVLERGFLCVSLWVCSEQSRRKFFSEMAKDFFFLAKVLAKVHVDMSKFALYIFVLLIIYYVLMIVSCCKNYWGIFR